MNQCPCGSPRNYQECCGRFHGGGSLAPTAEALMRSRYSAFACRNAPYLLDTWHPTTCPKRVLFGDARVWDGLDILATTDGDLLDDEGTVEFVASFVDNGVPGALHELSRFVRFGNNHRWVYEGALDASLR